MKAQSAWPGTGEGAGGWHGLPASRVQDPGLQSRGCALIILGFPNFGVGVTTMAVQAQARVQVADRAALDAKKRAEAVHMMEAVEADKKAKLVALQEQARREAAAKLAEKAALNVRLTLLVSACLGFRV